MSAKHQEHWARTKRWFARFAEINTGKIHNRPSDEYHDDVYAFFVTCYHMKDWLKNDPSLAAIAHMVEPHVNASDSLRLCADICNGHKHLTLTNHRSGENPQMGARHFKLALSEGVGAAEPKIQISFTVDTKSGPKDAFQIAEQCMADWRAFLVREVKMNPAS